VTAPKAEALVVVTDQGPADNTQQPPHSEAGAAIEQADKMIATARAKLALLGYQMHVIDAGHGRSAFLVMRWDRSRELANLGAVNEFIRQVGGGDA
jgi:hypothetical protein